MNEIQGLFFSADSCSSTLVVGERLEKEDYFQILEKNQGSEMSYGGVGGQSEVIQQKSIDYTRDYFSLSTLFD